MWLLHGKGGVAAGNVVLLFLRIRRRPSDGVASWRQAGCNDIAIRTAARDGRARGGPAVRDRVLGIEVLRGDVGSHGIAGPDFRRSDRTTRCWRNCGLAAEVV